MKKFFEKYGAYLVAAVLFVILGYTYCKPVLSGKVLQSGDDVNAVSAVQEASRYAAETGDHSWWNGAMFSGMPAFQIGGGEYRADALLAPFIRFLHRGPLHPAWIFIFYFVCFFVLMRSFGVDRWLSIVGAIAVALSSYFIVIIAAGHGGKTIAISYITLVAAGFYLIYRKKYGLGAAFVMFFTAVGFSIHPQMAYYLYMMIGLFFLAELWIHARDKRWKDFIVASLIFIAALGIGLGTGSANIFANREYAAETMRGGHSDLVKEGETVEAQASTGLDIDYATQWSYGIDETFTFLIPGFKGGSSNYPLGDKSNTYRAIVKMGYPASEARAFCSAAPLYWGDQPFTAGNVYMGAIVCFLFLLGCILVPGPYKWALLAATVLSTMLAWGSNLMWLTKLFFNYFPMYNKFRAVSSILIVAEIAMPLLGFLGIKALMEGSVTRKEARKGILIAGGVTAGLSLFFALLGGSLMSFVGAGDGMLASQLPEPLFKALVQDRADLFRTDSWRSFAFIVAASAILFFFNEKKLRKGWMIAGLGALVLVDMWNVDQRYFNDNWFMMPQASRNTFAEQPWETRILQDTDPNFRVLNLTTNTFNEARTSYRFKSIGGYHAAKLRRYQDLIDVHLKPLHMPVINMLNAKYFVVPDPSGQIAVQQNPGAFGNAWFVEKLLLVNGANAEIDSLGTVDLTKTAVVDSSFASFVTNPEPGIAEDASVTFLTYTPKQLDYEYTTSQPGTLVFSEIYYPHGWKVTIDGQPAEHFRANYTLRALNVPAGSHHITFLFDPDSVRKGDTIATACVVLMYLLIAAFIVLGIVKCRKTHATAD